MRGSVGDEWNRSVLTSGKGKADEEDTQNFEHRTDISPQGLGEIRPVQSRLRAAGKGVSRVFSRSRISTLPSPSSQELFHEGEGGVDTC